MKKSLLALGLVTVFGVVLLCAGGAAFLVSPQEWPLPSQSVSITKTNLDGQVFVVVQGQDMNYLNQFQILSIRNEGPEIHIERFSVKHVPWVSSSVNQQFPIYMRADRLITGSVEFVVHANEGPERHTLTLP